MKPYFTSSRGWEKKEGLELIFNNDLSVLCESRNPCCKLVCLENYPGSNSSASPNITSMSIYQKTQTLIGSDDGRSPSKLLATLTFPRPNVSYKADGVNAKGTLTARWAIIEIELDPHHDCFSDYRCELHTTVDNQGTLFISESTLVNGPKQRASVASEGRLTQSVMLRKWAYAMNKKIRPLESQNQELQNRMLLLERDMQYTVAELKNKQAVDLSNIEQLYHIASHTVERIESHISDKLRDFFTNFSIFYSGATHSGKQASTSNALIDNVQNSLVLIQGKLQALISEVEAIEDKLTGKVKGNSTDDVFTNHAKNVCDLLQNQLLATIRYQDTIWKNLTVKIDRMTATSHALGNKVSTNFAMLQEKLWGNSLQTEASINKTSTGGLFSSDHSPSLKQAASSRETKSREENLFHNRACERGMAVESTNNLLNSYTIINPHDNDVITSPYLCDTVTDGGGWIVIQRRMTGNIDFIQTWAVYKQGFGSLFDEFWLGNDNIHAITSSGTYELKVDLKYEGKSAYAWYSNFSIDSEENKYTLRLGDYIAGGAGDSLSYHRDMPFSTFDMDNDKDSDGNCAFTHSGAWWFDACAYSSLNGQWQAQGAKGIWWKHLAGSNFLGYSEMKIRFRK
ncbi:ficolin-1 [Plakobranchus ocellatus]|uniref:Ficolin-1 n=1 Tax=Plakobranchus ocellatus TaxID=259542 RepID=A0AAV4CGL7_9GAST|nr:ficolin-1 [Plakobranchus ocellatus]